MKVKKNRIEYRRRNQDKFLNYQRSFSVNKPHKALLYEAKKRAKNKRLPFDLKDEDIIIPAFCPVLGIPIVPLSKANNRDNAPSIDRTIPELGYIKGNIEVISYRANRIKNDGTVAEHEKILNWMKLKSLDIPTIS